MTRKLDIEDLHWVREEFQKRCPGHTMQYCFVDEHGELFFSFFLATNTGRDPWWFTAKTVAEIDAAFDWAERRAKDVCV